MKMWDLAHFVCLTEWNNFKKDTIAQKQIFIYENDTFEATTGGPGSDMNILVQRIFNAYKAAFMKMWDLAQLGKNMHIESFRNELS